jgi:hypothetical protein
MSTLKEGIFEETEWRGWGRYINMLVTVHTSLKLKTR